MFKRLVLLILIPYLGIAQDSTFTQIGVGISKNSYPLSTFDNLAFLAGRYRKNSEFGLNLRYFRTDKESRINKIDNFLIDQPLDVFYQFQASLYYKSFIGSKKIKPYILLESGLHFTNAKSRNRQIFIKKPLPYEQVSDGYVKPHFSAGIGIRQYFGHQKRLGYDLAIFLSNNKVKGDDIVATFYLNSFLPVKNISAMLTWKFKK